MKTHFNDIPRDAIAKFDNVVAQHFYKLQLFLDGVEIALKGMCPHISWKELSPSEREEALKRVKKKACERIVNKSEKGGAAERGLKRSTFDRHWNTIKRAVEFDVPLEIAEQSTKQELQKAQKYVKDCMQDAGGSNRDKMVKGFQLVKEEQIKHKGEIKKRAEQALGKRSVGTLYTLPDPHDYADQDTEALLRGGIAGILNWLKEGSMEKRLECDTPEAKVLRRVLGELAVYDGKKPEKTAVA